jgi:hypothetical protein
VDILAKHDIPHVVKWVDNFDFLRYPLSSQTSSDGFTTYTYLFDLSTILNITNPLGIPWHDVSEQGHDFAYTTEYGGFTWDLPTKRVSVSTKKCLRYITKVHNFLSSPSVTAKDVASTHGTLQHLCFVYCKGRAFLPGLSRMLTSFSNNYA